jgi:hypothetical protein
MVLCFIGKSPYWILSGRSRELAEKGWYHSFELPDGTLIDGVNPLDYLRMRERQRAENSIQIVIPKL